MWKYLIIILPTCLLLSCVTRKVVVSKVQENTKTDSVVVEKKDSVSVTQNAITLKEDTYEIVVTPIDTTKPIVIGEKPYFNATVRIKKTKKEVIDSSKTTVSKVEEKKTDVKKEGKKDSVVKSVDKKSSYFNLWWLLLIPFVVWLIRHYLLK